MLSIVIPKKIAPHFLNTTGSKTSFFPITVNPKKEYFGWQNPEND